LKGEKRKKGGMILKGVLRRLNYRYPMAGSGQLIVSR